MHLFISTKLEELQYSRTYRYPVRLKSPNIRLLDSKNNPCKILEDFDEINLQKMISEIISKYKKA